MKVKQRLLSFLIAGFIFLPAISAFAADEKIYPGAMGVKVLSTGPNPVLSWSRIGNPSSTRDLYVNLPVINDITSDRGVRIKSGSIHVVDLSSSSSIRCTLNTVRANYNSSGLIVRITAPMYSRDIYGRSERIYFKVANLLNPMLSTTYYSCRIPRKSNGQISYINSYRLSEEEK